MATPPKATKPKANEHGSCWISPTGSFYEVPECLHYLVATELGSTSYTLEQNGWLHMSYGNLYFNRNLTQAQIDTVFDFIAIGERKNCSWVTKAWDALKRVLDKQAVNVSTDWYGEE